MNCANKSALSCKNKKTHYYLYRNNTPHTDTVVLLSCFSLCRILPIWATLTCVQQFFYLQRLHHTAMVMCLISSRISRLHCLWHSERMNMAAQNKRSQQRHAMPCFCAWSWASMPASINTQLHHHNSLPKYFWPLRSQQQLRLHPANQCS